MAPRNRNRSARAHRPEAKMDKLVRRASVATVGVTLGLFVAGVAESAREYISYNSQRDAAKAKVASVIAASKVLKGLVHDGCYTIPSIFNQAPDNRQMAGLRSGRLAAGDPNVVWPVTQRGSHFSARWFSSPTSRKVVVRAVNETLADTSGLPLTPQSRPEINTVYRKNLVSRLHTAADTEGILIQARLASMRGAVGGLEGTNASDRPLLTAFGYFLDQDRNLGISPGTVNRAVPTLYGPNGGIISSPVLSVPEALEGAVGPYCLLKP